MSSYDDEMYGKGAGYYVFDELPALPTPKHIGNDMTVLEAIEALNNTGRVSSPLRANQRGALYAMLAGFGVTDDSTKRLVSEADLISMYEAALRGASQGKLVADRIAGKYGVNPLLDKPQTVPSELLGKAVKRQPDSERTPTITPVTDKSEYATKRELRDVQSDMKREHKQLNENLVETCLKLAEAIPGIVEGKVEEALDNKVPDMVREALKSMTPVTLTVSIPGEAPTPLGMVHRKTPDIIKMLAAGVNVYLHGPAGSGKTTAGRKCAEAFGLAFYFAAKVESEYMLLGFKDARGETVRTQFREAYEHGGVFLFDELDGSSPSAVVAMNAALANGICPFPDGIVMRHSDFKCIAAGNTKLSGANRQYVGRNQLDAASVDRFAFVEFGYDDALETALATNANWCKYVQAARKAVADRALPHLITPRATYDGCKLIEAGLDWVTVKASVLWKGLDSDTVDQIVRSMPRDLSEGGSL